ncbi:membrane dipeptidase [Sarocladium strictum]
MLWVSSDQVAWKHPYQSLPIDERVKRILRDTPIFDGHNDLPQQPFAVTHGKVYNQDKFNFENGFQRGMTDIPRLREGAVGAQFWSVCVPILKDGANFSLANYCDMARDAIELIDMTTRLVQNYPDVFEIVGGPGDVARVYAEGKIACSIGIEGLHMAGNSIGIVRAWYQMGVRYITLTHNCNNAFADSSQVEPVHGGLSRLGRGLVVEMNRLGMIVDLSHASEDCVMQVLDLTRAPVMFSHSNVKAVFDCARNVPDSVLDRIPANGGVIMLNFVPEHVATHRWDAKMEDVLDHIFYVANRIGWDHVGLGSDFDGVASVIPGLEDVTCYPKLIAAVLDRGATEVQVEKLISHNLLRVWTQVVAVREQMKREGVKPVEDVWEGRTWWRFNGHHQIEDPDPEDERGWGWFAMDKPTDAI